jgi:hypothetical protein
MIKNENATTLQPTNYYIGDLCYVMHDCWEEVCDLMFPHDTEEMFEGELELADGRKFITYGTAYGDGQYTDQNGKPYAVDSGTLGAIKVDEIRDLDGFNRTVENGCGHVHEFPTEINEMDCYNQDGEIGLYTVVIDTAMDYYTQDDEEYDPENDED